MPTTQSREAQVAHDQATATAAAAVTTAHHTVKIATADVHYAAGDHQGYVGRTRAWTMTDTDAEATLRDLIAAGDTARPWKHTERVSAAAKLDKARADLTAAQARLRELNDQYTGWARFFEVTSSNGHIHSSMGCSTCRITTQFGWHPQLSGLTEADAVAELGPILCSVCFPSAPVEWRRDRADIKAEADAASGLYCAGQGTLGKDIKWRNSPWGRCGTCGEDVSVTSTGKVRRHKK